jgi:hypothetical protein
MDATRRAQAEACLAIFILHLVHAGHHGTGDAYGLRSLPNRFPRVVS